MVGDFPRGERSRRERRPGHSAKDLLQLASLAMRVRVWVELLRERPDDASVCQEVRSLAAALVHWADQHGWSDLGEPAGRMIRELSATPDHAVAARLRILALRLEHVANERALGGTDRA